MTQPMEIDFHIAVPSKEAGNQVAAEAEALGYSTSVWCDEESKDWTCACSKKMLVTYDGVISCQSELEKVASPHGGYPDGWGTFGNADE